MRQRSKRSRIEELDRRSRWLLIEGICIGSFLLFSVIGMFIGGSAMLGASHGDHYFVGQHGHLTEVPFGLWLYSWVHTLSQAVTFPLAVVSAFRSRTPEKPRSNRGGGTV
jgi:hypothetical protein